MIDRRRSDLLKFLLRIIERKHRLAGYEHERGSDAGLSLDALVRVRAAKRKAGDT